MKKSIVASILFGLCASSFAVIQPGQEHQAFIPGKRISTKNTDWVGTKTIQVQKWKGSTFQDVRVFLQTQNVELKSELPLDRMPAVVPKSNQSLKSFMDFLIQNTELDWTADANGTTIELFLAKPLTWTLPPLTSDQWNSILGGLRTRMDQEKVQLTPTAASISVDSLRSKITIRVPKWIAPVVDSYFKEILELLNPTTSISAALVSVDSPSISVPDIFYELTTHYNEESRTSVFKGFSPFNPSLSAQAILEEVLNSKKMNPQSITRDFRQTYFSTQKTIFPLTEGDIQLDTLIENKPDFKSANWTVNILFKGQPIHSSSTELRPKEDLVIPFRIAPSSSVVFLVLNSKK